MAILAGVLARDGAPVETELALLDTYARLHGEVSLVRDGEAALLATRGVCEVSYEDGILRRVTALDGCATVPDDIPDDIGSMTGDFALVSWDARTRTLVLARDAFGARPLYYTANERRIVWASHLAPLLQLAGTATPDEEAIAAFVMRSAAGNRTPVREVCSVPPASFCVVRGGALRTERHWRLDPEARLELRSEREAEERLRALLFDAVRMALRGSGPATVMLSGGVDSSVIVGIADAVAPDRPVQTISYVFDASRSSDERQYIAAVEERRGIRGTHIGEREQGLFDLDAVDGTLERPTSYAAFARRHLVTRDVLRGSGSRLLLTGIGGDDVLYGDMGMILSIADALRRGRLADAARQLRVWSPHVRQPYLQLLWRSGIAPLLAGGRGVVRGALSPWWSEAFAQRLRRAERTPPAAGYATLPSRRVDLAGFDALAGSMADRWFFEHDEFEMRQPFLYRPLVEYCFALPFEQKLRPGETRSILRRAVGDLLPPAIRTRVSKSGPDEALHRAMQQRWRRVHERFGDRPRVVEHGFAGRDRLAEALRRGYHGMSLGSPSLLRLIGLELWLQWLERRPLLNAKPPLTDGGMPCTNTRTNRTSSTRLRPSSSLATPPR